MAKNYDTYSMARGKFLELQTVFYVDDAGRHLQWEACQRVNQVNAASIFAIKRKAKTIVLIRQFRPPVGKYCIECPAGLIEPGESALEAARREMLEETGYAISEVVEEGVAAENSAGMTGELVTPVVAFVDEGVPRAEQRLDDAERIEVLEVPLKRLTKFLKEATESGDVVSGKLLAFSYGMRTALQ